jgi:hypothetical protein
MSKRVSSCRLLFQRWYERHRYDFVFYRRLEKQAMMPWLSLKPGDRVCELSSFNGANVRAFSCRTNAPFTAQTSTLLLPLLRWLEQAYGSGEAGYVEMVCAVKPASSLRGVSGTTY